VLAEIALEHDKARRNREEQSGDAHEPPDELSSAKMSARELAEKHTVDPDKLRKRLDTWRYDHDSGYVGVQNRKPREPKYLYDESAVMPVIEKLKQAAASGYPK